MGRILIPNPLSSTPSLDHQLRMVNSREPAVDSLPASGTRVTIQGFWLLVDGFYIWEYLITLDLEWNVIRGRRPHRWTIWIYSLTRLVTLAFVAMNIISIDASISTDCQTAIGLQFILSYLVLAASSLMIVLRVIAIWDKNRTIVAISTGIWGTNIVFLIQGATRFRSTWDMEINDCVLYLDGVKLSTISAFVTDITLLLMMLLGLYRIRRYGGLMTLGRLLWNQGLVWLLVAIVAELTPTVFVCLDINGPFRVIFMIPWVITMSIAATRMYRCLSNTLSSDVSQKSLPIPNSGRTPLETNGTPTPPVFLAGIQVAVHKVHVQPYKPQENHFATDITGQPHVKLHELTVALDHDSMESGSRDCVL